MRIAQQPTAADAYDAHRMSGKASAQRTRILEKARRKDRYSGITIRPVGLPVVGQGRLF